MGFHGVFIDTTWSQGLGFYWSRSETQKGAEDMGQIKALVGGLPMTPMIKSCGGGHPELDKKQVSLSLVKHTGHVVA